MQRILTEVEYGELINIPKTIKEVYKLKLMRLCLEVIKLNNFECQAIDDENWGIEKGNCSECPITRMEENNAVELCPLTFSPEEE